MDRERVIFLHVFFALSFRTVGVLGHMILVPCSQSFFIIFREKCKISPCGLLDLQLIPCGIKVNSKFLNVCQNNNLTPTVKFRLLT